ncbi:SAF domain-containing protein [Microbacterium sp. NRRL B-14842]|uniref:SAF domain-containing protein n=1 Tax=Microbacterium sp. NRRL B-14842 TaxID=3162881 RepID=UPI003D2AB509
MWWVTTNLTRTVSVMATSVDVSRGETITTDDLTTIQLAGGQQVDAVSAADAADLVGTTALVDLPAGTLITSANTGDTLAVPAGSSIVGVTLTQAQMPGYQLAAGDKVRVVETPVTQGDPPVETPKSFNATVFTATYDTETQVWVVDLVVPNREGTRHRRSCRHRPRRAGHRLDGGVTPHGDHLPCQRVRRSRRDPPPPAPLALNWSKPVILVEADTTKTSSIIPDSSAGRSTTAPD